MQNSNNGNINVSKKVDSSLFLLTESVKETKRYKKWKNYGKSVKLLKKMESKINSTTTTLNEKNFLCCLTMKSLKINYDRFQ